MNKETRKEKIYNVGDLVQFVGNNESSYIALIVNRQLSHLFDEYEYLTHNIVYKIDKVKDKFHIYLSAGGLLSNIIINNNKNINDNDGIFIGIKKI